MPGCIPRLFSGDQCELPLVIRHGVGKLPQLSLRHGHSFCGCEIQITPWRQPGDIVFGNFCAREFLQRQRIQSVADPVRPDPGHRLKTGPASGQMAYSDASRR